MRKSESKKLNRKTEKTLDALTSMWRGFSAAVPRFVYGFYVDGNHDYGASVLLAGSGRGGTTWLAEAINFDNSFRLMFEPFHGSRVPQCRAFHRSQYLRPQESDPTFLAPAQAIFSGQLRNPWIDGYNRTLWPRRRLIKDIRVNLMLGWIRRNFPAMPVVLLLRHPCAVAYSRSRLHWHSDLESTFLTQPELVEDYLQPFLQALQDAETELQRYIVKWCVETYVPLMQLNPGEVLVTTYEDCVLSPKREMERIFDHINKPFSDKVLESIRRPSSQTRRSRQSGNASAIVSGESIVEAWRRSVAPSDAKRAIETLERFGLAKIYGEDSMPNTAAIEEFMRAH